MKKIKIGILGTANIAAKSVIPTLKNLADYFEIVGVAGRDMSRTAAFCNPLGLKAYEAYEYLLQEENLDAVYIPLPNALHYEWVMKALDKGLHVMCEKSLGCNYEETLKMNAKAKENKLLLMEHFQFRFHSQLQYIQNLISNGTIGEIRCVRSSFGLPPFPDANNIRYQKELGGGALLDTGAYPLKISQIFLGNNLSVKAATLNTPAEKQVDIWGGAYLQQQNGNIFAEIAFGFDNLYQCNVEIWGSKGKIYTNRIFTSPANHTPEIVLELQNGYNIEQEQIKLPPDDHFKNIWSYFYDTIINQSGFETEYAQNINQARLIDELANKANEQ